MKDLSYWLDIPYSPRPPLTRDIQVDVAVVGGGITGISTAYHCVKQGLKTVLIEKNTIASGSAGRNGGMVVEGFAIDFLTAAERYGLDTSKDAWLRTVAARKTVQDLIRKHDIDCDLSQPGSLYLASTEQEAQWIRQEAAARKQAGIDCELIESGIQMRASPFLLALYNQTDCLLHPVKFVRGLAEAAEKFGAVIYENAEALNWDARSVTTASGKITADKVVLTLETANPHPVSQDDKIIQEQAIVTEPLTDAQLAGLDWQRAGMMWTEEPDYTNIRKIGNRLFTSYKTSLAPTDAELLEHEQKLIGFFLRCFPTLHKEDIRVSHRWLCRLLLPPRSRPYIGQREGIYEALGQGTNGLTNGIIAGQVLADHFEGRDIPALYQFEK